MKTLALHRFDGPCPSGWYIGNPDSITDESTRDVLDKIGTLGNGEVRTAVSVSVSYNNFPIDAVCESIRRICLQSEKHCVPVYFHLDGINWWDAHPELWNFFDPSLPGYDPDNRKNVEWYDWDESCAVKLGWRNWGSQIRVRPAPNLASPRFLALQREKLDRILPIIRSWRDSLEDKTLFGGIVFGWELSPYVQAYFYENGNDCYDAPRSEDPTGGVENSIALGYAAAKTLGLQPDGGVITEETVEAVCAFTHDFLIGIALEHGIEKSELITHTYVGGKTSRGGGHSGIASVREGVTAGWSFYGGEVSELDPQIAFTDGRWALIECRPWDLDEKLFLDAYRKGAEIVNIYNWESIRDDERSLDVIRKILG